LLGPRNAAARYECAEKLKGVLRQAGVANPISARLSSILSPIVN